MSSTDDAVSDVYELIGNLEPGAVLDRDELKRLELFRSVESLLFEPILRGCPVQSLGPREVLITAGQPNEYLYLVLSGRLSIHLDAPDGSVVATLAAGESAGEMSVIDDRPASAYVVADMATRVLVVDEELMWMLTEASHVISNNLLHTLVRRIREGNDVIRQDREQLRKYQFQATVDVTTGLFNRFWLQKMLPRQMNRARSNEANLTLLMIDIDHFKRFNDTHGHVTGDYALQFVGSSFIDQLRSTDMAARFGGEEFVVILPGTDIETATRVGERLRQFIARTSVVLPDQKEIAPLTISVGVAEMPPKGDMESFIEVGDQALYRAKAAGRNRVSN